MDFRKSIYSVLDSISITVFSAIFGIAVAKVFSVEQFGMIATVNMLSAFLSYATFGMNDGYAKICSEAKNRTIFVQSSIVHILLIIVFVYLALTFGFLNLYWKSKIEGFYALAVVLALVTILKSSSHMVLGVNLQTKKIFFSNVVMWLVVGISWPFIYKIFPNWSSILAIIFGFISSILFGLWFSISSGKNFFDFSLIKKCFFVGVPIAASSLGYVFVFYIDRMFILFQHSATEFGLYAFILGLSSMTAAPSIAIASHLLTHFRHLHSAQKFLRLYKEIIKFVFIYVMLGLVVYIIVISIYPKLIELYFPQFREAMPLIKPMLFGGLCMSLLNLLYNVLHSVNSTSDVIKINILTVVCSLLFNSIVYASSGGLYLYAVATAASYFLSLLVTARIIYTMLKNRSKFEVVQRADACV